MKQLKYFLTAAAIGMMVIIFLFSAEPADESTELSNGVGYLIGSVFIPGFQDLDEGRQLTYVQSIDHTVRKCAHAAEYLILSVLCIGALFSWLPKASFLPFPAGFLITVLYAVSDEIHQMFVPGRACMFTDVLIDASGAAAGLLIFWLIRFFVRKNRANKKHADQKIS